MVEQTRPQVIAIEEHYWDRELVSHFKGGDVMRVPELEKRLYDLGELRLKEMDEAGIDIQVISHGAPSAQKLSADIALELDAARQRPAARRRQATPDALRGLRRAADRRPARRRPTSSSAASTKLGFKGAMMHGLANGRVSRRPAVLADLRARRRRSTCRSISTRPRRSRP